MALNPFVRRDDPHMLVVGMTGVKMGDRLVQFGCEHGARMAAVAGKVGLSGRAVAVVSDQAAAARAQKGAAQAGVLVEVEVAPLTGVPLEDQAFDVAVIDDTGGMLAAMQPDARESLVRETARVLRPGGRTVVIGTVPRGGFGALFGRGSGEASFVASGRAGEALLADGFKFVRILGESEGLVFLEGLKPRDAGTGAGPRPPQDG